jgi:hypothetical protein
MSRTKRLVGGAAAMVAAIVLTMSAHSFADHENNTPVFSVHSIKGAYGCVVPFGMALPPSVPQAVPAAVVGRVVFDGEGGCSIRQIDNINGQVIEFQTTTCQYTVSPEGIGTTEATIPGFPTATTTFVVVQGGQELHFVFTTPAAAGGTATRQ